MARGHWISTVLTTSAALAVSALLIAAVQHGTGLAGQIERLRLEAEREGMLRIGGFTVAVPWAVAPVPALPFAGGKAPSWPATDRAVARLQEQLNSRPEDASSAAGYAQLGSLYLQKARETGDPSWYVRAEGVLQKSLDLAPGNVPATVGMGGLHLARHGFAGALEWGQRAIQSAPRSYVGYGIAGDAYVELGRYDEAVVAIQTMVDLRPDLTSLSRVSYLRELHGDLPGAIEAMHQAVNTGAPRAEATNWARVHLGHLHFLTGDLDAAERQYRTALAALPDYVYALGGLARVEAARGRYKEAIALYVKAQEIVPVPEHAIALAELYRASGNSAAAARQEQLVQVIAQLQRAGGVDVDLEMALFEVDYTQGPTEIAAALQTARAQHARRPDSIHANDVLAWALYRSGRAEEALPYAQAALRLGTRDPLLLYHAGAIAAAAGRPEEAKQYLQTVLAQASHFSVRFAPEARRLLAQLKGGGAGK